MSLLTGGANLFALSFWPVPKPKPFNQSRNFIFEVARERAVPHREQGVAYGLMWVHSFNLN